MVTAQQMMDDLQVLVLVINQTFLGSYSHKHWNPLKRQTSLETSKITQHKTASAVISQTANTSFCHHLNKL